MAGQTVTGVQISDLTNGYDPVPAPPGVVSALIGVGVAGLGAVRQRLVRRRKPKAAK